MKQFAQAVSAANEPAALFQLLEAKLQDIGFEWYNYRLPVTKDGALLRFSNGNYPIAWVEHYSRFNFENNDLVFQTMAQTVLPFSWSAVAARGATEAQQCIFDEARDFKIRSGAGVSIPGPGRARGQFAVGSSLEADEFEQFFAARRNDLHLIALHVHERTIALVEPSDPDLRVRLTPREIEVLKWVARGKTNWEIARIIVAAEPTVKEHVANICRKFGVKTKLHAVSLAVWLGCVAP